MESWVHNIGLNSVTRIAYNETFSDRAITMNHAHKYALEQSKNDVPFILFEDDACPMQSLPEYFDIPEEADLIYLGGSTYEAKPLKLENDTELLSLMSIYSKMKYDNSFAKKLKESTCKPSSKFHLNILLDNKRIESINILESGTPTKYSSLTVRYLSDLMSDEIKKIPFILELKGWKEEQTFTYYVREDRSLCSENKSFKDFDLLSEHKANDFFVLFYDFDLSNYSRYLRKTEKLEPRSLFLVKMLECLGITFKIEENVNLDKLIIE